MGVKEASAKYQFARAAAPEDPVAASGFKRTEVGVIPEDWEAAPVATLIDEISMGPFGSDITVSNFVSEGVPVLNGANVSSLRLIDSFQNFVTPGKAISLKKAVARRSDVVITHRGTIGQVSYIPERSMFDRYVISQSQFRVRFNKTLVSPEWIARYFLSAEGSSRLLEKKGHTGVPALSQPTSSFRTLHVPLPGLEEQHVINETLSDADALIESLQKLTLKKRALKQGAMQALLSGRQRLPGFFGEWQSRNLDELFRFSGGFSASRAQLGQEGHFYLHYGDIHGADSSCVDVRSGAERIPRIEISLARISRDFMLDDGDVVFVDASEDEEGVSKHVVVSNPDGVPFISGLHTIVAKAKGPELEPAYRRYCFHSEDIEQQFRFFAVGTKVQGVSKGNIGKIELRFPPSDEQAAIAAILSDMDAEIDVLEARLAKTRDLKAGMMQALLTGRIRLPLDLAA